MSTFLDDETLKLYVEESREHLETIEGDLLELEQQGANFDDELVNKVFRAAHSIKGGGGFLGLTNIKELAHKIENILHMVRTNQMTPNERLINTLLNGYDRLGEMIENAETSNEMDISDHLSQLEACISDSLTEEEKPSLETEKTIVHPKRNISYAISEFDLKQAQVGGKILYTLDFDLINDIQKQKKTPFGILELLEDSGIIVDVQTDISGAGDLHSDNNEPAIPMCVLFASIVEPDLIGIMFNLKDEQISVITQERIKPKQESRVESTIVKEEVTETGPVLKTIAVEQEQPMAPTVEESVPPPTQAVAKPDAEPKKEEETGPKPGSKTTDTLRVNVSILDQLMNRAGELVLARNQLKQSINDWDKQNLINASQRVDLVTSELQETIMLTRMQPVGIVFNKFPRVVRGLAMNLGKKINIVLDGTEVELDKTIIEGLADPLTHLVRNAADHGIELPKDREQKGKSPTGSINLRAFYESGQVIIEIKDDGKGLDSEKIAEKALAKGLHTANEIAEMSEKEKLNLIMLPGFSTAEKVTDISGRGVGMDVVKTNLDKLGGQVELISKVDIGSTIRIKLPLTLAIIPSLVVQSTHQRFAIPQANVNEVLRISASDVRNKIEKIGDADVLFLRGELLPVLQLNNVLELKATYYDYKSGTFKEDRRKNITDERLLEKGFKPEAEPAKSDQQEKIADDSSHELAERRNRRDSDVIIVILSDGTLKYGLIVDAVYDSVEVVVKPLGRHLKDQNVYSGATIMGDGKVALILDIRGLADKGELKAISETEQEKNKASTKEDEVDGATHQTLLIFHNGPDEACAVPLEQVLRVEQIYARDIEMRSGKKIIQYRGGSLTVYALEEVANVEILEAREKLIVIIFNVAGTEIGLLATQPLDVVDQKLILDDKILRQSGIAGSTIIDGRTTLLVDVHEIVQIINPDWFSQEKKSEALKKPTDPLTQAEANILLVEDSQFFRNQVKRFIEDEGYNVIEASDGQQAWEYIDENPYSVKLVVTDLEMPNMDGFELTQKLKKDPRFSQIPVIALTSLAADEDIKKGKEVGIDEYQIKLDKEKLIESLQVRLANEQTD